MDHRSCLRGTHTPFEPDRVRFSGWLRGIWLFEGCNPPNDAEIKELFDQSIHTYVDRHCIIAEPRDVLTSALLVTEGRILLYDADDSSLLRDVRKGEICGVTTALIRSKIGVTMHADPQTYISEIPIERLRQLARPEASLYTNVITHLRGIIDAMNRRVDRPVGNEELCASLLTTIQNNTFLEASTEYSADGGRVLCRYTTGDLRDMLGFRTLKTLEKYLDVLEGQGKIKVRGKTVEYCRPKAPSGAIYGPYD
jgi:hypothetical protein